jgi:coenzyme F420-0:L-glutamate ligase / coenzyme F420-1:gamma-L-glutamate ligase
MKIRAIGAPLIEAGADLLTILTEALPAPLGEGEVVCVASKVAALAQNRVVDLSQVSPTPAAYAAANRHIPPALAQVILDEADQAFPTPGPYWLTIKENIFIANAGVDLSNAPEGTAILWPENVWAWAAGFRRQLMAHFGVKRLGVVVVDSHLIPLRRGVTGIALAFAGFEGLQKEVGAPDLYGRPLEVTYKSTADDLASAAVLLMGEGAERTPFAVARGAPVQFTDREIDSAEVAMTPQHDLFAVLVGDKLTHAVAGT